MDLRTGARQQEHKKTITIREQQKEQGEPYTEHQGQGIVSQSLGSKLGVGHMLDLGSVRRGLTSAAALLQRHSP